jgi:hypothetical protein
MSGIYFSTVPEHGDPGFKLTDCFFNHNQVRPPKLPVPDCVFLAAQNL